jgi:hypothetical protein
LRRCDDADQERGDGLNPGRSRVASTGMIEPSYPKTVYGNISA